MIAPSPPPAYTIPDFDADRETIKRYEDSLHRRRRLELVEAEAAIRRGFTRRAESLARELKALERTISTSAQRVRASLDRFGKAFPRRILDGKPAKPSFWENLFSLGYANMLFSVVMISIEYLDESVDRYKGKRKTYEGLDGEKNEALASAKATIEERLDSEDWIAAFDARPEIAPLARGVKAIKIERAAFAARLIAGEVSDEELRDRTFAERQIVPVAVPLEGTLVHEFLEFGPLTYFVLRDLKKQLYHLPYDPRLEPLIDAVVDVYRIGDEITAALHRRDDRRPAMATDHYIESGDSFEDARLAVEKRRARLDDIRPGVATTAVPTELEQQTTDALLYVIRHGAIVARPREVWRP